MIHGIALTRRNKGDLAAEIARQLEIPTPSVSNGSSVESGFLQQIFEALGFSGSAGKGAYRKTERVLEALGLEYDPMLDSSEHRGRTGGSTITVRAYSRILSALTGVPRCFVLNSAAGAIVEQNRSAAIAYQYERSAGRPSVLEEAGPGSEVLLLTGNDAVGGHPGFTASARVTRVDHSDGRVRTAWLENLAPFAHAVPFSQVAIDGWSQHSPVMEISWSTFQSIRSTVAERGTRLAPRANADGHVVKLPIGAHRSLSDVQLVVPDRGHKLGSLPAPAAPSYAEVEMGEATTLFSVDLLANRGDVERNRQAEKGAIEIAISALTNGGWKLARDCQRDRAGYDLKFIKDGRELHVEVKGVQASSLAFNMTPKEFWRLEQDPDFVLVAVTNVLGRTPKVHLLTREDFLEARRVVTGYRISI